MTEPNQTEQSKKSPSDHTPSTISLQTSQPLQTDQPAEQASSSKPSYTSWTFGDGGQSNNPSFSTTSQKKDKSPGNENDSKSTSNPKTLSNDIIVPNNSEYIQNIKDHMTEHQRMSHPNTPFSKSYTIKNIDYSCRVCYPVTNSAKKELSREFKIFWEEWFKPIYRPRHYSSATIVMFEAAQREKDFNVRIGHLRDIVLSIRFSQVPEEGIQDVIGEINKAWDQTVGFTRLDDIIAKDGSHKGGNTSDESSDNEEVFEDADPDDPDKMIFPTDGDTTQEIQNSDDSDDEEKKEKQKDDQSAYVFGGLGKPIKSSKKTSKPKRNTRITRFNNTSLPDLEWSQLHTRPRSWSNDNNFSNRLNNFANSAEPNDDMWNQDFASYVNINLRQNKD
jgi:hypothetical protein